MLLNAERMIAASTVLQTLTTYPFFLSQGDYWRFDPQQLLDYVQKEISGSTDDVVEKWCKATGKLLHNHVLLTDSRLKPPFRQLQRALHSATQKTAAPDSLIAQLNNDSANDYLQTQLQQQVQQWIDSPNDDAALNETLQVANDDVWQSVLRRTLEEGIKSLQKCDEYERAADIAMRWNAQDEQYPTNLKTITDEADAWKLINVPLPTVEDVLLAIEIAPTLLPANDKLHVAAQDALQQYDANYWLAQANDDKQQAVDTFYTNVKRIHAAREKLTKEQQTAFDTTVAERAFALWKPLADDVMPKLSLLLRLHDYAPTASLHNDHFSFLVETAQRFLTEATSMPERSLHALLLARITWKLLPHEDTYIRPKVAAILAQCHIIRKIWELAINKPWHKLLDTTQKQLSEQLRKGMRENTDTHLKREQALLTLLQQSDETPIGRLLLAERETLQQEVTEDIKKVSKSMA